VHFQLCFKRLKPCIHRYEQASLIFNGDQESDKLLPIGPKSHEPFLHQKKNQWDSGGWQAAPCSRPRPWGQLFFYYGAFTMGD